MKKTIGILALVACAGIASASTSFTPSPTLVDSFTVNNIASVDGLGDLDNVTGTWNNLGSGTVDTIRVTGTLTSVFAGTYASEARVRFSPLNNNSFAAFNVQASTVNNYSGSIAIDRTVSVPSFTLAPDSVGIEWFESYNDGDGADSNWDTVTYEFLQSAGPTVITNGNVALGSLAQGSTTNYAGSHVSGGIDLITFTIGDDVAGGGYLNIRMLGGAVGGMSDTEIALYDGLGNFIATDDDGSGTTFFSMMSFGALDPNVLPGDDAAGSDGLFLPAGTYTLVTGGYNTVFGATLGAITPGTNAGSYDLSISYVPTPGALALLGMGGLIANRRRR